jgi:hypothetical protein
VPPSAAITAFTCDLKHGSALVTPARVTKYWASPDRTPQSDAGFIHHEGTVASQNV